MPYLTEELVEQAEPRQRDFILWDNEITGFGIRVTPAGNKTFVFQWRLGGRAAGLRRRRIGRYGEIEVAEARQLAADARQAIQKHKAEQPGEAPDIDPASDGEAGPELPRSELERQLAAYFERRPSSRSKIMAAATRIFIRDGYDASLEAIAQDAGVARPTIYRYFTSKEDLLRAVIGSIANQTMPTLPVDRDKPPYVALLDYSRAFRKALLDDRQMALFRIAISNTDYNNEIFQLAGALSQKRTLEQLTRYLRWAVREGLIRKVDPETAAEGFMGLVMGFARTRRMLGLGGRSQRQQDLYLKMMVETFVRGLEPEGKTPEGV